MRDFHGIIFAYKADNELRELVAHRTSSSLPFCGRYRVIDFALSSMMNAGIHDVGIIMQRDYQSLLDHIGSGKAWDMSRKTGGLRILPPFGLPGYHTGEYAGTIEALNAVRSYIFDIKQEYVVLMLGNLCANIDVNAVVRQHIASGNEITAICTNNIPTYRHHKYIVGEDGQIKEVLFDRMGAGEGVVSLECYVVNKSTLLEMMDDCQAHGFYRFHQDAVARLIARGGKMGVYVHDEYAAIIRSVDTYYRANMDMLDSKLRMQLFPASRPVRTKVHEEVSTYYGVNASANNCLVADNCIIEGTLDNCIVFPGCRVEEGARLRDVIIMRGCKIGKNASISHVIADKGVKFSANSSVSGSSKFPFVVPKNSAI